MHLAYPQPAKAVAAMRSRDRFSFAASGVSLKSYEAPEDDGDRFDIHDQGDE